MAEHFQGKTRALHTTAGGGELFLRALVIFGDTIASAEEAQREGPQRVCLGFISERLAKGNGWYHIPAYPLPSPLSSLASLHFLASTIQQLAQALIDDSLPAPLKSDFDNRDLRLRWAAFALEFYELIRETFEWKLPDISLRFQDPEDLSMVSIHRQRLRLTDAQKCGDLGEQLRLLSEIIALEKGIREPKNLWSVYLQRAEVQLEMGDSAQAIESLLEGARYATGEDRALLLETVEILRRQA